MVEVKPEGPGSGQRGHPSSSIIVPCHLAAAGLASCLEALRGAAGGPYDVLVVDDNSADNAAELAREAGFRSIRLAQRRGAGQARNEGIAATTGDILLFVDSDVVISREALSCLVERLRQDSSLAACFGLYSETAGARGFVSDFRNLIHRYAHLGSAGRRVSSFFTAIGAVRREDLEALGGFPEVGALEDVIFGDRLARLGRGIVLEPGAEAVHLKPYTLGGMVRSVLLDRGVPWGYLAAAGGLLRDEFATSRSERLAGVFATLGLASLILASAFLAAGRLAPAGAAAIFALLGAVAFVGVALAEAPFWRWLASRRGWLYVVRALPVHLAFLVSGSLGFGLGYLLGLARIRMPVLTKGVEALE